MTKFGIQYGIKIPSRANKETPFPSHTQVRVAGCKVYRTKVFRFFRVNIGSSLCIDPTPVGRAGNPSAFDAPYLRLCYELMKKNVY